MNVFSEESSSAVLPEQRITTVLSDAFRKWDVSGERILCIIPDHTRSGPLDQLFRLIYGIIGDQVASLDYLIALGTHPPMDRQQILDRVGVTEQEMETTYRDVHIYNHLWEDPDTFTVAGVLSASEVGKISEGRLAIEVPVRVNKMIYEYDQVIICGPVFPHEVVGFSGGNKYFFPGISGQEVIDFTHWLGALITSHVVIGTKDTPVRRAINRAASEIDVVKHSICFVVKDDGIAGIFAGSPEEAWSAAADLSAQVHVTYLEKSVQTVLSVMPQMYDDIWTGAKGMYKMEPVVADGGEVIIYAPHITEFSYTHGKKIEEIGYHVRDYFLQQWDRFKSYPWGVIAHSTHLRGDGTYNAVTGQESPRIRVSLATGISEDRCHQVNLGYRDPASIDPGEWQKNAGSSTLVVPKAGELLYRLKSGTS